MVNDVATALAACIAGQGVAQPMELGVRDLLRNDTLLELFPDWHDELFPPYVAVRARSRLRSSAKTPTCFAIASATIGTVTAGNHRSSDPLACSAMQMHAHDEHDAEDATHDQKLPLHGTLATTNCRSCIPSAPLSSTVNPAPVSTRTTSASSSRPWR